MSEEIRASEEEFSQAEIEAARKEHKELASKQEYWDEMVENVKNSDIPEDMKSKCIKVVDQYKEAHMNKNTGM